MTSEFEQKLISRLKSAADKLERQTVTQDIRKALAGMMQPEYIDVWLSTPNPAFGDRTPFSLIQDGREQEIWDMIYELNTGMPG